MRPAGRYPRLHSLLSCEERRGAVAVSAVDAIAPHAQVYVHPSTCRHEERTHVLRLDIIAALFTAQAHRERDGEVLRPEELPSICFPRSAGATTAVGVTINTTNSSTVNHHQRVIE